MGPITSRQGSFAQGALSPTEPESLQARAAAFNAKDPRVFKANGLNQPVMMSSVNGNSTADAERQTPNGQLPSMNGMSSSTYQKLNPTSYGTHLGV